MKKKCEHIVTNIHQEGIAQEMGIEVGDILLKINNQDISDIFDYHYLVNDEYIELLIKKPTGEEWLLEIDKEENEDLGMDFESSLMDEYRSCHNKCIFCFIDQNPPGMRPTIYFKDDDSRLSFLQGNYITLTNMSKEDIDRIVLYNLAPINISVHTTNPELRCTMLNNRFAGEALAKMDVLFNAEIVMNGQIVLCRGINDGIELEKTIEDLMKYLPYMQSLSVVPVGISKYREGLFPLEPFNKEDAIAVIRTIEKYQKIAMEKWDTHFVHASDEWYIKAELPLPEEDNYDGYIQIENGVGMIRAFDDEVIAALMDLEGDDRTREVSVISGVLGYEAMCNSAKRITEKFPNIKITVFKIINHFFGEQITVTGLLTGKDIIEQIKNEDLGDKILISCNTLKADEDIFLDDVTLEEFQKTLQVPVTIVQSDGMNFVDKIIL